MNLQGGADPDGVSIRGNDFDLQSLVSPVVSRVILDNVERLQEDFAQAVPAVVLCADLSGFSLAGAQLIQSDDRGAEELRGIVNAVFALVTGAIQSHGGEILQFSGDAVTAAWPAADNPADETIRAIAAGLAIQQASSGMSVGGIAELRMRVSIALGPVWIAHIARPAEAGDIIICGDVFDAFKRDGSGYRKGVFIAGKLWASVSTALAGRVSLSTDSEGVRAVALNNAPSPADPASAPETAKAETIAAYVPAYLRDLLDGTATDWLAEFRSTQILFARFSDFSLAGNDRLPALSELTRAVRTAIESNGGVRLKFGTDDKGLVLLAGWGLQSRSFENNAERALTAAGMVHDAARAAGFSAGVGVTGGKVFAGLVGTQRHREYTVIGDPVNRAASLSGGASGETRVDDYTRQAAARRFSFAEAGTSALKGHSVASHFVVKGEAAGEADQRGEMVGRAEERAKIEALVAALAGKAAPGLIHIVGDAGLGKSRLAGYFQARLAQAGIGVLRMNADSLRRTTGYYPWRQLFGAVVGARAAGTAEQLTERLGDLLRDDPGSVELLPLLSPVLPTAMPDTELTASLFGGGRAEKTQSVMMALLKSLIGAAPQVLIVEDAHWFDSASWQLLERFARAFPDVAITLVSRPLDRDALPFEARRLLDRPDATTIELEPFSRADSAALINASLGVVESAPGIVDLIYRNAEGHPLFTGALALSLRDQGLLRIEQGYAHLRLGEKGLAQIAFPDGVEGVVAERIASLTPPQQLTLKVAAVLGRAFDLDLLSRLHPAGVVHDALAHEIAAAERAGLVEPVDAANGRHRFHHAIIGDTAYKLLVSEQRRKLHARTAEILNARGAAEDYPASSLALLAHHFEQADLHDQAVDFLIRAAESARLGYNNAEVVDFLTRALRIVDKQRHLASTVTLGSWNHRIAEALKALGHYQRAADFLFESARLLDRAPPKTPRQAMFKALGSYAEYRLRPHRAPQPAEIREPMIEAAEVNMTLSEIHYELNKVPFSLAEVLRGVNLARQGGGDSTALAKIYMGMALTSRALPWALDGNDLQQKSIAMAERLGDLPTISWVYLASGAFETGKGGWVDGEAHFRRSMQVADECGDRKIWETAMSSIGNLKRLEGWFEEAMACSDVTLAAARDRDISHAIAWSHNGRLRDLLCLNRLDEAREDSRLLNLILNDPKKKGETNDNSNIIDGYARALLALADGDIAKARAGLDDAVAVVRGMTRPQFYMVQNISFMSDVVWNLWRRTGDKELLGHSAAIAKSGARMVKQYRTGKPLLELAAGDDAWYRGKPDAAVRHWLASAEAAGERGMRYVRAQALFRADESGLLPPDYHGPEWQALLAELGIKRPDIWSFAA